MADEKKEGFGTFLARQLQAKIDEPEIQAAVETLMSELAAEKADAARKRGRQIYDRIQTQVGLVRIADRQGNAARKKLAAFNDLGDRLVSLMELDDDEFKAALDAVIYST